jgi:hypothetical protein
METRSKVKGIPQRIPATPFVEEISETLPSVQGINPALCKQQLVEEFPESKFLFRPKLLNSMFLLKNPNILSLSITQPLRNLRNLNLLQVLKLMIWSELSRSLER